MTGEPTVLHSDTEPLVPQCPFGEEKCPIIDQLVEMKKEVILLTEQVRTDTLTGLFNFRHFMHVLELEMERTLRTDIPTALIIIDLDYFKKVNDTWGHEIGNQALVNTAKLLRESIRQLDIPCRYGGEEFTIILPSIDIMASVQVAERIRDKIEKTPLIINDSQSINLTASFGIAFYNGHTPETPENFVARADHYLYQAKETGRNRICHEAKDTSGLMASVSEEEKGALFDIFTNESEHK